MRHEGGRISLGGLLGQQPGLTFGTGVVDRHIQTTKARDGLVDEIAHVVLAPDIGTHEFRLDAESAQLGHQLPPGVFASTGNNHVRTFLSEGERGCAADAGQCAGNEYDRRVHRFVSLG